MHKILFPLLLIIATALTACDKWEDNGDLAGNWQMQYMISATTADTIATKADGVYYRISRELFQISGRGVGYLSTFRCTGDSLFILPHPGAEAAGETFTDFAFLDRAGATPDGGFRVNHLTSHRLILSNAKYLLIFRKY